MTPCGVSPFFVQYNVYNTRERPHSTRAGTTRKIIYISYTFRTKSRVQSVPSNGLARTIRVPIDKSPNPVRTRNSYSG